MMRRHAMAGALCAAVGAAAFPAAGADPATCQAIKPVYDELVAAGSAVGKAFGSKARPDASPGRNTLDEVDDHYRRVAAAADAAAAKVSDPDVEALLQRISDAFDTLASEQVPNRSAQKPSQKPSQRSKPSQKPSTDNGDGAAFANLEKACGYLPDH